MSFQYKDISDELLLYSMELDSVGVIGEIYTRYGAAVNGFIIKKIGIIDQQTSNELLVKTFCLFYENTPSIRTSKLLFTLINFAITAHGDSNWTRSLILGIWNHQIVAQACSVIFMWSALCMTF